MIENPQIIGLILDILGAFYLAKGFMFKKLAEIVAEAFGNDYPGLPGGMSENIAVSLYRQRVEAIIGSLFLFFGFLLQGVGVALPNIKIPLCISILFVTIIFITELLRRYLCSNERMILEKIYNKDKEISSNTQIKPMENKTKATIFVLACVVLWAFIPVVSRLGQQNLDNYQFLFWSSFLSFVVLAISSLVAGKKESFKAYSPHNLLIAFGLGFLGTFLYYLLLYFGYAKAKGLEVLVIQYTWPIFIVIFSVFFLKEKLTWKSILSCILGFLGVLIVLTKGDFSQLHLSDISVDLIVLMAAGIFGLFSVLSKKVNFEPFTATTLFFLSATFFSFISMIIFSSFQFPSGSSVIPILGNGILINGFSYILWLKGLSYAKASSTAPLVFLTPILAAILIVVFFKEAFLPIYLVGLILVVAGGLISGQRSRRYSNITSKTNP